jgi:hypothetical protein
MRLAWKCENQITTIVHLIEFTYGNLHWVPSPSKTLFVVLVKIEFVQHAFAYACILSNHVLCINHSAPYLVISQHWRTSHIFEAPPSTCNINLWPKMPKKTMHSKSLVSPPNSHNWWSPNIYKSTQWNGWFFQVNTCIHFEGYTKEVYGRSTIILYQHKPKVFNNVKLPKMWRIPISCLR